MKIFAFTDVHANINALKKIRDKLLKEKPDLIICCGDLSFFGNGLDASARLINSFGIQTLIIPGNHESEKDIELLCKKYNNLKNIHKTFLIYDDILFYGFGTGGFSFVEPELEKQIPKLKEEISKFKRFIFVTHAPIYGTKLDIIRNKHLGCKSSRELINIYSPELCLCGHFHEAERKKDKIKNCLIINPGKFGMIIKI